MRSDRRPDELALSRLFDLRCAMVLRVAWLLRRAEGLEVVERLFRLRSGVDDRARVAFEDAQPVFDIARMVVVKFAR